MAADHAPTRAELRFLADARRAILATIDSARRPRLVPICFVAVVATSGLRLYSPLDEKPKRSDDPLVLGRVRDIRAEPEVHLLVDRWSEDWARLAWLRLDGRADILLPGGPDARSEHATAVAALREKYQQYATHHLESRPVIRIAVKEARSWGALDPGA